MKRHHQKENGEGNVENFVRAESDSHASTMNYIMIA